MKRIKWNFALVLLAGAALSFGIFAGCDNGSSGDEDNGDVIPAVYNGFYNYPLGRVDQNGRLSIKNNSNAEVLLFDGKVEKDCYLGTVNALSNTTLKLSEEKFYSIVAVEKSNYEEKAAQASQTSYFTYYSNTTPYQVDVSVSGTSGTATWMINNPTNFWVRFVSVSGTAQNYAVVAPKALRVAVPIQPDTAYDYRVYFTKEITFNGKVIATVDTTDPALSNTAVATSSNNFQYNTLVGTDFNPSNNVKPSILIKNNTTDRSVYVRKSNVQLNNGVSSVEGLPVIAGTSQIYVGLEVGDNLNTINFENVGWTDSKLGNLWVEDDIVMEAGKVYTITLTGSLQDRKAVVSAEPEDASNYFED
ncbi:MAG: hypothetical protein HDR34_00945 [Treponema sp.]|nr:hypothetical protein [Treponema sp.]